MYLISTDEAHEYLYQFEQCTLPAETWTHEMHLIIGMAHALNHGPKALPLMRQRIKAYNLSVGKQNTDTSGYHETMTVFWLWQLRRFCIENSFTTFDEVAIDSLIYSETMTNRNRFLEYYSLDAMTSVAARRAFLAPDLQPMAGVDFLLSTTTP